MKTLKEQNAVLKKYFKITIPLPKKLPTLHSEAVGLFLIPKWERIGKDYNDAVMKVLETLKKDRSCYDYRDGNWSEKYLRQHTPRIMPEIVSAQMGKKYKGVSVKKVRDTAPPSETLMGIYEVAIIVLTNPDILKSYDDLWIDCPGDEYSYEADGVFSRAPFLWFRGDGLKFDARVVDATHAYYGSSSVFPPQSSIDSRKLDPLVAPLDTSDVKVKCREFINALEELYKTL